MVECDTHTPPPGASITSLFRDELIGDVTSTCEPTCDPPLLPVEIIKRLRDNFQGVAINTEEYHVCNVIDKTYALVSHIERAQAKEDDLKREIIRKEEELEKLELELDLKNSSDVWSDVAKILGEVVHLSRGGKS